MAQGREKGADIGIAVPTAFAFSFQISIKIKTFRKEPDISDAIRVKLAMRNEKSFSPENNLDFRENDKGEKLK